MNRSKTKLMTIAMIFAFALTGSGFAQVKTILDVYQDLPGSIGDTITVEGFYYHPDYPVLGLNQEMFEIRLQPSPHSLIELTGTLPDSQFSYVEITGVIDTLSRPHPLHGITYVGQLHGLSVTLRKSSINMNQNRQNRLQGLQKTNILKPDECTFAMLLCSDHERLDFWQDMTTYWIYVTEMLGLNPENIYAFYGNGTSRNEAQIPSDALRPATKDAIRKAYDELKAKIAQCEAEGKPAKLVKLVTDHGSGYHSGSSNPEAPQGTPQGWGGGHIDKNGDENDKIPETDLKFDFTNGPAAGKTFYYDLDDDGTSDFKVVHDAEAGLIAYAWNQRTKTWVEAGRDTNGDKKIDKEDGGIDLNGDGDKTDSFAWDEDLWMSYSHESILDDEWASWQKELSDACLDSIFELIDCCFSGGFINDMEREIPCKTAVRLGAACEEGEYSHGSVERGGGWYTQEFFWALLMGWITWEDVCCAGGDWTWSAQTPQNFKKDGTGNPANSGKGPYRYRKDYDNPPKNGWRYYANEGDEMRDMVWKDGQYVDPKYGKAHNDKGEIVPDEENGVNVKIALHPNINKDLGGQDEKKYRYRINARALPKGASLRIWIANSAENGFRPNPADVVKEIMPHEIFKGGDIISRTWPVILGKDIQHCQWIIAEVDPGEGPPPKKPGLGKVPGKPDTIIFWPPPWREEPPDTIIIPPPPDDGDIIQCDPWADFGDAPDNSLKPMSAGYDPPFDMVEGAFPTLLATANSAPAIPGNHHWDPYYIGLGPDVSVEADAYAPMADEDPVPNIDPFFDVANQDSVCDGLLTSYLPMAEMTELQIIIRSLADTEAYLNVLCDWNRDGKWDGLDPDNGAPEWAVQNQLVKLTPVYNAIWSDSFLVSPTGGLTWMRINLSLGPIGGDNWDGAGEFEYGEVEDYLIDIHKRDIPDTNSVGNNSDSYGLPKTYELSDNYPNPFNPSTQIHYALPKEGRVSLIIYNILGNKVRTLVSQTKKPGNYDVFWDGRDETGTALSTGTYFYQIRVQSEEEIEFKATKKLLMIQ